ncbi:MAG TPA: SAM-dependent methyltransferase [Streptosporangiaceae bacterium]|nr:SAM-dependent methyltransferase [Streptosporangiaceae bacterium]
MTEERPLPTVINTNVAHPARLYDYWLGGKDNFAVDRELAEKIVAAQPGSLESVRANRAFLKRAVRHAADAGIRQFIDIGSGLPTVENTHEIARQCLPDPRVVYVDIDPIAIVHGRALLADAGSTAAIQGDVRHPEAIFDHPELRELIDFDQPVAVLLLGVLHYVAEEEDPYGVMSHIHDAIASDSHVILSHLTGDDDPKTMEGSMNIVKSAPVSVVSVPRTYDQIERLFEKLEVLDPGIVPVHRWRPDGPVSMDRRFWLWAGVARKP